MSALDQAFIKAYAKDPPNVSAAVAAAPQPVRAAPVAAGPGAQAIEQIYHDGSLYRLDTPLARPQAEASIPAPHYKPLPPTSPRRGVRRSMLKLLTGLPSSQRPPAQSALSGIRLAAQDVAAARAARVEKQTDGAPRIARKVIIRHVSHATLPPPLGREKAMLFPVQELPPEALLEPPPPVPKSAEPAPTPSLPLDPARAIREPVVSVVAPPPAPRSLSGETPIAVQASWDMGVIAPMVLVAHPAEIEPPGPEAVVTPQVAALLEQGTTRDGSADPSYTGKIESADPSYAARLDAPHARSARRPHVRFDQPEGETPVRREIAPADESLPNASVAVHAQLDPEEVRSLLGEQGPAAVAPVATASTTKPQREKTSTPRVEPLWEVDRFHWPRTCEKLLADKSGYFAHAGDKLLAASKDGLRVLGITGSRRGEGRTTLALCLARAAAEAGLNVALLDADFTRPQIASRLGIEAAHGWQDAALGKVPLSEAAIKSVQEGVTVLPLDTSAAGSRLSLADTRVTAVVRAASAEFDLVILDLGPLAAGEGLEFPPGEGCPLDAAIVVRDLRFASTVESEAIGQSLYDAGIDAVGIAENFVVEEK